MPVIVLVALLVAARPTRRVAPRVGSSWIRGMNFTAFCADCYSSGAADQALEALRATGTDSVAVVPYWYMTRPDADTISPDAAKTPTDASVAVAMARVRALGMQVVLKPQLDVLDGTFRGQIAPASLAAWFASYERFIDHYATIAQRGHASLFVIGDELTSVSADTAAWRRVIAGVRRRYSGPLTYAANWVQAAEKVGFWSSLNEIGVDAYMPFPLAGDPSVGAIVAAWRPWIERLAALHRRTGLPVLFTELGYPSATGALTRPAQAEPGAAPDQHAQAAAYDAAYLAWRAESWFRGILWWNWPAAPIADPARDTSLVPAGKLAAQVIGYWDGVRAQSPL